MNIAAFKETAGRRFARFVTNVVVPRPRLWRIFRPAIRAQFDALAPRWDALRSRDAYAPYDAALAALPEPPARALDLGTGTGGAAFAIARRFPAAEIVGADLAEQMLEQARRVTPPEFRGRVRFEVADAAQLPYESASFDLVGLSNMIPFFDELARVVKPGGHALFSFSGGASTPIYVAPERLRSELSRRGFSDFAEFSAGSGTSLLARKGDRS